MNKVELVKKLRALAENGCGGEKINAQKKLDELMAKYGIADDELDDEEIQDYFFEVHGDRERQLLVQIIYKVQGEKGTAHPVGNRLTGRVIRTKVACSATKAQKIEIEMLFDFYKRLYKKEEQFFFDTFIQKHELFGELKDGEEGQEMSDEDYFKMRNLMRGMADETPLRQIEGRA